jgi:hypothetical protein
MSFSTIVFAICEALMPVASEVFRHCSRTARTASWCSLDSPPNQLRFVGDGFALSRISFAKSIRLALKVNPAVVVGNAAALDLFVVVIAEDEVLGWRCFSHSSSVA